MFRDLLKRWSDWTGDKHLERAIHSELRRGGYAVHASRIFDVRLVAIERPGWVQVTRFAVETTAPAGDGDQRRPVVLLGIARDDARSGPIRVLVTEDEAVWRDRLREWSDGLITTR